MRCAWGGDTRRAPARRAWGDAKRRHGMGVLEACSVTSPPTCHTQSKDTRNTEHTQSHTAPNSPILHNGTLNKRREGY